MKFICIILLLLVGSAQAEDSAPTGYVSQAKFNRLIDVMRRMYKRMESLEDQIAQGGSSSNGNYSNVRPELRNELDELRNKIASLQSQLAAGGRKGKGKSDDGAVDLDALDSAPSKGGKNPLPILKVYFDLNLYSMPGGPSGGSHFTFDTFHSFILLDIIPTPDIHFFADVNPTPKFYELDLNAGSDVTFRLGKITVPFDDMNPHNIFGGRTNVSRLTPDANLLPDLFTDLGVGVDWKAINNSSLEFLAQIYAVNGFRSGGTDPVTSSSTYPTFGPEISAVADNNKDKALGARGHVLLNGTLGIGASYYTGRWSNNDVLSKSLTMIGADAQFYLGGFSVRAGQVKMSVQLPSTATVPTFTRGANYVEIMQKIGAQNEWRFWLRGGTQNLDNRIVDKNDREILGGGIGFKPNLIEWSLEHSRDMKRTPDKTNYTFTNFRVIASF